MTSAAPSAAHASALGLQTFAVVVSCGVTPYLDRTLRAVAAQTRPPEVVLLIDAASRTNGLGDGTPVEDTVAASGLDNVADVRVVRTPEATTFLAAVRQGLNRYVELVAAGERRRTRGPRSIGGSLGDSGDRPGEKGPRTPPRGARSPITRAEALAQSDGESDGPTPGSWIWLLHDDSAPEPTCLAELRAVVANTRTVAMAGPKQVDWDRPEELLEVGLRTTGSARRANDIVEGEIDQGQYDSRSDVLAVGTAGALVRRSAWSALDALSDDIGPFGDGLAISRALRLAGHRVVVVPRARIRHRRASYLGLRPRFHTAAPRSTGGGGERREPVVGEPAPDIERSFRARRTAQLRSWAILSPRPLALLLPWILVLGLIRAAWRLLSKTPGLARDELAAAGAVSGADRRLRAERRRLDELAAVPRSVVAELYVPASEIRAGRRDRVRQERERAARAAAPSELELRELAILTRRRRRMLAASVALAAVIGLVGTSGILIARAVTGGALPLLDLTWRQLWEAAWSTWSGSGDGYPGTLNPLLAVLTPLLALGSLVGLDGGALVHLLVILAVPLAAAGAWYAAGTVTRRTTLRAWAALVWAGAPALLLALGQGRLAPVLVHLTLPWALTALARAVGVDRRDTVLSGLVGARHLTREQRDETDRLTSERLDDLGRPDEEDAADDAAPAAGAAGPAPVAEAGAEGVDAAEADAPGTGPQADSDTERINAADAPGAEEGADAEADADPARAACAAVVPSPGEVVSSPGEVVSSPGEVVSSPGEAVPSPEEAVSSPGEAIPSPEEPDPTAAEEDSGDAGREAAAGAATGPADDSADNETAHDDPAEQKAAAATADDDRGLHPSARAAAAEHCGPGSPTAAALAGLLLGVVVAAAPSSALVIVPVLVLVLLAARGSRARLMLTLVPVAVTAAPACWRAWRLIALTGSWHGGLRYLLTDPGLPVAVPGPSGVETLLGLPVSLEALLAGTALAQAPRFAVLIGLAVVPVLAAAGLLTRGRRGRRARTGALLALGGLALALLAARHVTGLGAAVDGPGVRLATGWAGTGISLALAGMLASALTAGDAVRAGLVRYSFGWRHLSTVGVGVVAVLVPVLAGGAWAAAAAGSTGEGARALVMALRPASQQVPVIAGELERAPAAGRVLVLTPTPEGMTLRLWRGRGTQLTDVTPDVLFAQLADRTTGWSDARLRGGPGAQDGADAAIDLSDAADADLADVVARAVTGQDEQVAADLAAHGVAVVLLTDRVGERAASARAGLDATPGLEPLAQTAVGTSWRVGPSQSGDVARLTLVSADGAVTAVPSGAGRVSTTIEASDAPRTLVLAERADPGWRAVLDGAPLSAAAPPDGAWRQAFTVPAGAGGELVIEHRSASATAMTRVIWIVWALTILWALPLRGRRSVA
ncbi:hypothetical protein AM609_09975 [Actinomyces sp. oral taxon 414]|uniref:glycosyltransferase family 2 protein n=1 Tax=Actinomyces sp. oral taxon 414 TaxID=712122 RepID=UPI0006AF5786|nr:glycosyltransferase [Actinomyces sp. oral taxon 414]ALC99716.1 hypothetical protein AM609_09975 [Actinomyces sp. oral taxon 414]